MAPLALERLRRRKVRHLALLQGVVQRRACRLEDASHHHENGVPIVVI